MRRRRKALDLTQATLAQAVSCSRFAIRKIEADERRPSRRLAERLAEKLAIPAEERAAFIEAARSVRAVDTLDLAARPLAEDAGDDEPSVSPPERPAPADGARLVGRSSELGQLIGLLARVAGGEGQVVLIEGEAGIGKSRLLQEIVRYATGDGRNAEAIRRHEEAVGICERLGLADRVAVQAFHGRGEAHFAAAEPHAAIACYSRSIEYARAIGDKSYEAENVMMIGWAATGIKGIGDYRLALERFESALAIVQAADLQWHWGPTVLGRDHVRACLGHYRDAWIGLREALHQLEELALTRYSIMAHELLGHLLLDLNRNREAAETLERGLAIARAAKISFWQAGLQAALAIARLRAGSNADGQIEEALQRARNAQERYLETRCLEALAEASFARKEPGRCQEAATALLGLARPGDLREQTAIALRWRGEASAALGELDAAGEALAEAEGLAQGIGRPRLSLDMHRSLARLARKRRRSAEARRHDEAAAAIETRIAAEQNGIDS